MKEVFTNSAFCIVFVLAVSSLSACSGGTANSQNGRAEDGPRSESNAPADTDAPKKSSEFPPLVASIANADLELLDGSIARISERKGKVVLLNLWAIWCAPCRAEMPHLVEMHSAHKDEGFQVIGLNIGDDDMEPENVERIKAFAQEMNLNYELARISEETTNEFNKLTRFGGVPQSVLIDRDGNLRGVFLGGGPTVIKSMKATVQKVVNE